MKYIVVRNEKESRNIQNKLFKFGYEWIMLGEELQCRNLELSNRNYYGWR